MKDTQQTTNELREKLLSLKFKTVARPGLINSEGKRVDMFSMNYQWLAELLPLIKAYGDKREISARIDELHKADKGFIKIGFVSHFNKRVDELLELEEKLTNLIAQEKKGE